MKSGGLSTMKTKIMLSLLLAGLLGVCSAQDAPPTTAPGSKPSSAPDGGREPGRRRPDVVGKITAINGKTLTIKSMEGRDVTVTVTDSTRFVKDRQPVKLSDFKVGDMAIVRGRSTGTDAWEAELLGTRTGGSGGFGPGGFAEGLGKKFIAGEIKAIDGTHLTIARMDGETQSIAVDENTSFRKEGESVTLADFKVGDHIYGPGELKDGTFTATTLNLGDPRMMRPGAANGDRRPN
jgi:hypothetical protein